MVQSRLLVFDLDGTLVDSAPHVANLLNELRMEIGKPSLQVHDYMPWLSLGGLRLIENGLGVSSPASTELLKKFRAMYRDRPTPKDCLFRGVEWVLQNLRKSGYQLSLCTNKPGLLAKKVMDELQIGQYFHSVCAAGDLSSLKPDPANLLWCLRHHQVEPVNTIMVGDSRIDQLMANRCSVPFYWHNTGSDDGVDRESVSFQFNDFYDLLNALEV